MKVGGKQIYDAVRLSSSNGSVSDLMMGSDLIPIAAIIRSTSSEECLTVIST